MKDWNVVVSVPEHTYKQSKKLLAQFGHIAKTNFYNVFVMKVADSHELLSELSSLFDKEPQARALIGRIVPAQETLTFQTPEEFEEKAQLLVKSWVPQLTGKGFHVRMHRRGFKGKLASQHEEQFLDHYLMEQLKGEGMSGEITFDDPDAIVAIETVNQRAGLSLWTRETLRRYPFLKID
ncbi:MAG: THUMP domain-containing protein [Gammaproteobacteria bacterium]|nr:THUMP domain-containing protein [Gammaproteobacteria bacterium]